ncbi:MAG: DUF5050 domain-containing protein [Lachnospiraceae bacterium]|nr:DUF5050 domain-containing protein [Lachnospiraceae bacterium]
MKKNFTHIIVLLGIIIITGALMLVHYFTDRIPSNPSGTIGNTAGNLNNGGLFCERDGMVYFSNPMDQGSLYSMTVDETNLTKLYAGNICNILAGSEHLYYFMKGPADTASLGNLRVSHAFYRSNFKGKHVVSMTADVVVSAQLVNDYLYLLTSTDDGPSFYKMNTDRSNKIVLANYTVNPACAKDGVIYYNGTGNNHYLYALNTESDVQSELWKGNIWYPVLDGNYFYYLDVENNYRLCRYDYTQNIIEVLTDDRVECFNVGNGYIYYQCNSQSTPALKMMRVDGSDVTTIAEGNYTAIHMTSKYVYFQAFGEAGILYHSLIGSDTYSSM